MYDHVSLTSLLILGAVATYVLGFLCRDQVRIRALVVLGSVFYAAYYWIAGPEPLWDAILGTALIGAASLQGVIQIFWSRMRIAAPRGTRHILSRMGDIEPGLFRRLMKSGTRLHPTHALELTRQDEPPDSLWFVVSGSLLLERAGQSAARIDGPCFVGEIAWLRGSVASATVTAAPGAELVQWPHARLRRTLRQSHRLELALDALIAQDLARKLSRSAPVHFGTE